MNRKGQTGGLITGLIFGVASLVIGVIIAFVIVSTLNDADLLDGGRTTNTVTNETNAWLNETSYTLDGTSTDFVSGSFSLTAIWGEENGAYNVTIGLGNATVSDAGLVTNATTTTYSNVSYSYTNTIKSDTESSSDLLSGNFSAGVDNVSEQIPTVLLVAAVVLILSVLAILVGVWTRMRMGGGSDL